MKKVVLMALALGLSLPAMASEKVIDMYKSENCGCCSLWGKAMEKDGIEVRTHVMNDQALSALKEKHAVPAGLRSCHTAVAGNLIIEGHVPATGPQQKVEKFSATEHIPTARQPRYASRKSWNGDGSPKRGLRCYRILTGWK